MSNRRSVRLELPLVLPDVDDVEDRCVAPDSRNPLKTTARLAPMSARMASHRLAWPSSVDCRNPRSSRRCPARLRSRRVADLVHALDLQGLEEALHCRAVPAVRASTHRLNEPELRDHLPILATGVLHAAIPMRDDAVRGLRRQQAICSGCDRCSASPSRSRFERLTGLALLAAYC